jgi:hypothetical protein
MVTSRPDKLDAGGVPAGGAISALLQSGIPRVQNPGFTEAPPEFIASAAGHE